MNFYDSRKMKEHGILFGCNMAWTRHPLDFVVWQDSNVTSECVRAPCAKVFNHRRRKGADKADPDTTYVYGFGKYTGRDGNGDFELSNSGCVAFQLIHYMGFDTCIIVGCDCAFLPTKNDKEAPYKSNIFQDRQAGRIWTRPHGEKHLMRKQYNDKTYFTNKQLTRFSEKFGQLYERFKKDMAIFKLGDFGILPIPHIEWEAFWSSLHPRGRRTVEHATS